MSNRSQAPTRLDILDPCSCEVSEVGPTGYTAIPGITADFGDGLFGIENTTDQLLTLDTATGAGTPVGALGYDFGTSGATWCEAQSLVYGIDGTTDALFEIDPVTGLATTLVGITGMSFGSVSVELLPANGTIYACTNDSVLYSIDPQSGVATAIGGGMDYAAACDNLAAPWTCVSCLEE
jgi:hypothetical protein